MTKTAAKSKVTAEELHPNRPTPQQIADWKEKHGKLYKFSVNDKKGNPLFVILRQPKMTDMEGASRVATKNSPLSSVAYIVRNCALYIDDEINKNDDYLMSICAKAENMINIQEATMEEL